MHHEAHDSASLVAPAKPFNAIRFGTFMNDKRYLFGYEFKNYCMLCSGVRSTVSEYYYPLSPLHDTKRKFPCYECEALRSSKFWMVYER